jgi:Tol biopolymer transport system component
MTAHAFRYPVLIVVTALALTTPMRAQSGHELFQQALSKERAEGKLQEAIALYQRVVEVASSDHALAARALLQLGRCYEQLGNTEARSAYERLIARYPDQADLVAQAKTRLEALVRTPAVAPAGMTVQPLPEVSNDKTPLAVSPDGAKAIVWDYSKGQNIALYDFSKKQTRLLTDIDWVRGLTWFAVWSPDTRRVAYTYALYRPLETELRVTTLDGRSSLAYRADGYSGVQPVGWTPDGATLVIVVQRPDKTWAVGTLPATGGQFTALRSLGWSYDYRGATPRLSPDGRFIAFLDGETGLRDVHVVSLDGRQTYRITDDPADDMAPIWSPDGRHLAFMSSRLGSVSLWTVEIKDGKPVGQPLKLKDGMQSAESIDWTERGIFYSHRTRTWDLYTLPMDPVEGRPAGLPRPIPYSRTGRNVRPVWSPDGQRLAFVSSTALEPNRRYVVVMPAGGGPAREFLIPTTTWFRDYSPNDLRWFGDGRGLGFSGTDTRGAPAVFRLMLETGEWSTIPFSSTGGPTWTEWNTDGSAFYCACPGGISERAVSGDVERLVYRSTGTSFIQALEFSPDRKWLAFFHGTYGASTETSRILIANLETGETRTVLEEVFILTDPGRFQLEGWTPAGDLLVERLKFSATGNTTASEVLLVPVNGGAPRPIALPIISPSVPGEAPDFSAKWSPDGRSMVLGRVSRGSETFVIENPLAVTRATTASR